MNYVFINHKGKRSIRSHSEKQKKLRTLANCFFIHSAFVACFLVFVFVYLSASLFVCILVLISLSVFSSLLSYFNVCFLCLFVCLFCFVLFISFTILFFCCVSVYNIYCFAISINGVFCLKHCLPRQVKVSSDSCTLE